MFCPKCGTKNRENAKFCEKCGNDLNAASKITKENTSSPVKFLIVICVILIAGLGIAAGYILNPGVTSNSSGTYQQSVPSSNGSSSDSSNSNSSNSDSSNSGGYGLDSSSSSESSSSGDKRMCYHCMGSGKCDNCDGKGYDLNSNGTESTTCVFCGGSGKCTSCNGEGYHYYN
ncbi:zinc-ribbon domain-containing protein [Methanobacterium sp.]|uniref:zinc-ribbon domain-containing protein n=1 Tax=Methanobacterium sp. TaxID=2164 RepID=UPI003C71C8FB